MSVKQHTKPNPKPSTLATNPRSKPTPIQKPKTTSKTKKKDGAKEGGELDEKGKPLPLKNPDGGNPICPGGWKIDNDFDISDPLEPPFRCISALKDTSEGISRMMNKLNNPASSITDITNNAIPIKIPGAAGGGRKHTSRRTRRLRRSKRRKHTHRRNKK